MRKENIALFCPLREVTGMICKKWVLLVINEIGKS